MSAIKKKEFARLLFFHTDLSVKEIAGKSSCNLMTLYRWIKKEEWGKNKLVEQAKTITREELLQQNYALLKGINKEIMLQEGGLPNKEQAAAKMGIRKEIEALSDNPVHRYIEVFEEFISFMTQTAPQEVKDIVTHLNQFIHTKIQIK